MDWSQISVGAVGGAVGTWLLGLSKTGLEHLLEGRKQRAAEQRAIRADEREEAKKEAERVRAEAEKLRADEATLLMYKTQLKGSTNLSTAASVVVNIHAFFTQHAQYLTIAANESFLIKYPADFADKVHYASAETSKRFPLDDLKNDVDALRVETPARIFRV